MFLGGHLIFYIKDILITFNNCCSSITNFDAKGKFILIHAILFYFVLPYAVFHIVLVMAVLFAVCTISILF